MWVCQYKTDASIAIVNVRHQFQLTPSQPFLPYKGVQKNVFLYTVLYCMVNLNLAITDIIL